MDINRKLTASEIYEAGLKKDFDHEKGLDDLIKVSPIGGFIYQAGLNWPRFNYEKGFEALKGINIAIYNDAKRDWPKNWEDTKKEIAEIKNTAKPMHDAGRKLKLKEEVANGKIHSGEIKMPTFKTFYEDIEEEKITKELNEGVLETVGSVLGFTSAAVIVAFGGLLIVYGGLKVTEKIKDLWEKIKGSAKSIATNQVKKDKTIEDTVKQITQDPKVKEEKIKLEEKKRDFETELHNVYAAIESKGFDKAKEEFDALSRNLRNMPDIHKAIIVEISKVLKEPPLYVNSPGNITYRAIKQILGIRTARAAAASTQLALENVSKEKGE